MRPDFVTALLAATMLAQSPAARADTPLLVLAATGLGSTHGTRHAVPGTSPDAAVIRVATQGVQVGAAATPVGPVKFGASQTRAPLWGSSAVTGSGYTFNTMFTTETDGDFQRAVFTNFDTAPHTITSAAIAPSSSVNDGANPTDGTGAVNSGLFVPLTFNNGGSCAGDVPSPVGTVRAATQPAAVQNSLSGYPTSDRVAAFTCSDWVQVSTIPRIDGGTLPLMFVRAYTAGGMATLFNGNTPLGGSAFDIVASGRLVRYSAAQGDFATTPGTETGITPYQYQAAFAVQTMTRKRGLAVEIVGDSLVQGFGTTSQQNDPFQAAADALSTPAFPITVAKIAYQGMSSAAFDANGRAWAAAMRPDVMVIKGESPNDSIGGATASAATFAASMARMYATANWCVQNSIVPVLLTAEPFNYTAAQDANRIAFNASVRASGYLYVDMDAALTNGASPAAIQAQFNSTAAPPHYNDAGSAALVPYVTAVLQQVMSQRGR